MTGDPQTSLSIVSAYDMACHVHDLGGLLHACVHAGASINFVMPFTEDDSTTFWRDKVHPALCAGTRVLWIARTGGRIAGSVQLGTETPPNQPHRADVTKLMVHPDFRRRGIAKALMAELERLASQRRRNLITLDTRTGDSAEHLYASLGYQTVGVIPGYCRDPFEDRFDSTTVMYKVL